MTISALTTKLVESVQATTQGRVVFMLLYGICATAIYEIIAWNTTAAALLVLGYIGIAQIAIGAYFKNPCTEPYKRFVVEFCGLGYVLILAQSARVWNESISHEVMAGITVFGARIVSEYFGNVEQPPTTGVTQP